MFLGQWGKVTAQQQVSGKKDETEAQIWGGLFFAKTLEEGNDRAQTPTGISTEELADLRKRLGSAFEGKDCTLLGEHTQGLFKQYESWLVPSKELFLKLDSKGPAEGGGVNLHLQLWRGESVVLKTDATLKPDSPLFIEGPAWRGGNLVFVVLLK